jgi:Histidine kinase-like ATPase domain
VAIDTLDIEVATRDEVARFDGHDSALLEGEFPPELDSPGRARRLVVAALGQLGCGEELMDDVALVVTELASNAVLHARSSFSISVRLQDSTLGVAVRDGVPPDATAPNGGLIQRPAHGLDLISAISTRWGVERTPDGKVVWAELPYDTPSARRL